MNLSRRSLLKATGSTVAMSGLESNAQSPASSGGKVRFGLDLFSLRSQSWTPIQLLNWCAERHLQVVHFSEIRFLGGLQTDNLKRIRTHADELGIDLEIGMRSICPTSALFDKAQGTAEQQLAQMIDAARIVGSPIVRCVLGSADDRRGPGGIESHIEDTAKVLRSSRSRIVDAGLKIAIENHAGDMQARELKSLVEEAGPDFVGVCLDSGNPLWTIENPHLTLETLAPYVLTSHVRDSALWRTGGGAAVSWTRMGEGNVDIAQYIRDYIRKCPGRALSLEVIVTGPRPFNYLNPSFWDAYRKTPAWEFAQFLALAAPGTPRAAPPPLEKEQAAAREREDVEASIRWTQAFLAKL
ncbi:MAG: sugar phosphate isomerase/epimerase family protein [Bryobacteraceae bacterium]